MSRRCDSAQALDAWVLVRDLVDQYNCFHIKETDCAGVTTTKIRDLHKYTEAMTVISSFIANPERKPS